jgi:hypothetical protein
VDEYDTRITGTKVSSRLAVARSKSILILLFELVENEIQPGFSTQSALPPLLED